jgi:hypothetical protein
MSDVTSHLLGPLPCQTCDAWVASRPEADRDHFENLRWFLDDAATAADRPHQHVATATRPDIVAYLAALQREKADVDEINRLLGAATELATILKDDDEETPEEAAVRLARESDNLTAATLHELLAKAVALEVGRTRFSFGRRRIERGEAEG